MAKPSSAASPPTAAAFRAVFLNSIGGIGDTVSVPVFIEDYKRRYPDHTTVLYDSIHLGHYCERPPYVDEIVTAATHICAHHMPAAILEADADLPGIAGMAFDRLAVTRLVATHQCHDRVFRPEEAVEEMEFDTHLARILDAGFRSLDLRLKPAHSARVDALLGQANRDGRPLVGIAVRSDSPAGTLALPRPVYLREIGRLAQRLVREKGARVLFTGDDRPRDAEATRMFASGDWVDLDERTPVLYYRLEAMRRCALFLGSWSGFWEVVNLMRPAEAAPALQIFNHRRVYEGRFRSPYRDYYKIGGRHDLALVQATFRNPDLRALVFDPAPSADGVMAFLNRTGMFGR